MDKNRIDSIKKKINLDIVILFVLIICRIPRYDINIIGDDSFEVLWMGYALKDIIFNSSNSTWLVNFFSFLGLYPFSHYPIGIPLIIAILLKLKFSINHIYFLITIIESLVGFLGIKKLSLFIQDKKLETILIISYLFSPIFFKHTYFTVHPRGFILALIPFLLFHLFNFQNDKSRSVRGIIITMILMIFIHRLWIGSLIFIFSSIMTHIICQKIKKKSTFLFDNRKIILSFYFFILGIFFFLGMKLFPVHDQKIISPFFSNDNLFGLIFNLTIDYLTRIGILYFFSIIGAISIINNLFFVEVAQNDKYLFKNAYLFIIIPFLTFTYIYTLYSTILFLSIYILLSIEGIKLILYLTKRNDLLIISILLFIFSILISILYFYFQKINFTLIQISLVFFIIILYLIILLEKNSILAKFKSKISKYKKNLILSSIILSLLFFQISIIDGTVINSKKNFPYSFISDEEIEIVKYLKEINFNETIFVYNKECARKIGGYGFYATIYGNHKAHHLYYGWITPYELTKSTVFSLKRFISGDFFVYRDEYTPEVILFNQINGMEYPKNLTKFISFGIRAVIAKRVDGDVVNNVFIEGNARYSPIINSLANINPTFKTENLALWIIY